MVETRGSGYARFGLASPMSCPQFDRLCCTWTFNPEYYFDIALHHEVKIAHMIRIDGEQEAKKKWSTPPPHPTPIMYPAPVTDGLVQNGQKILPHGLYMQVAAPKLLQAGQIIHSIPNQRVRC